MKNKVFSFILFSFVAFLLVAVGFLGGIDFNYRETYVTAYDDGVKDGSEAVLDTMMKMINQHALKKNLVTDLEIQTKHDTVKVFLTSNVFLK